MGRYAKGEFGTIYTQFKNKPREAIQFLLKKQEGECIAALYRKEIGYIDIVWGEVTNKVKHTGYGLAHIVDKHGDEIKRLGFKIEDFILIAFIFGKIKIGNQKTKISLDGEKYRLVISTTWNSKEKTYLLTAFNFTKRK